MTVNECNNTTEGHTDIEYDVTLTQGEIGVILSYLEGEYLTLEGKDDIVSNVTRLDITSIFKKLESPVDDHYENHHYPFDGVAEQRRQTNG